MKRRQTRPDSACRCAARAAAAALAAALATAAGCAPRPAAPPPARAAWTAMSTFAAVSAAGADAARLDEYAAAAAQTMQDLEQRLSRFDPQSEIGRLNAAAGGPAIALSAPAAAVLGLAQHYAQVSGGAFDVTIGPLAAVWGLRGGRAPAEPPPPAAIRAALERVGSRHLVLSNGWARLDRPGMEVDLGGIAKGFAVDACFDRLRALGAVNVMVDLGGNLRCGGEPRPGEPWKIGVRHPFDRERIVGVLALGAGQAVATSGNYERFVTIGGVRYAHILDPRRGRPVQGMAGVTVVSTNAVEADAMSTALFVLGLEEAPVALRRLPGCRALLIPDRQPLEIWLSPGCGELFTPARGFRSAVRPLTLAP